MTDREVLVTMDEIAALEDDRQDAEDREDYATAQRCASRIRELRAELADVTPEPAPQVRYAIESLPDFYDVQPDGSAHQGPAQGPWVRWEGTYATRREVHEAMVRARKAGVPGLYREVVVEVGS